MLAKGRRRLVIDCLNQHTPALSMADLAKEVTVREHDSTTTETLRRQSTKDSLMHVLYITWHSFAGRKFKISLVLATHPSAGR
ncbi:DUF7344 domain-containing protein [Haladaptatus salinisoli]|uniref:DUF7344 domain-containing protein n=1 Tax=Haladaptatus salinisoli TaxID=2884876 RepID=UPI003F610EFF